MVNKDSSLTSNKRSSYDEARRSTAAEADEWVKSLQQVDRLQLPYMQSQGDLFAFYHQCRTKMVLGEKFLSKLQRPSSQGALRRKSLKERSVDTLSSTQSQPLPAPERSVDLTRPSTQASRRSEDKSSGKASTFLTQPQSPSDAGRAPSRGSDRRPAMLRDMITGGPSLMSTLSPSTPSGFMLTPQAGDSEEKETCGALLPESEEELRKREEFAAILSSCSFFKDMQSLDSSVVANVSKVAKLLTVKAGQVIFRQGDAPKSSYAIVKGVVAVFTESDPEELERQRSAMMDMNVRRKRTIEGNSRYRADEYLGRHVATLSKGSFFGELAMINDKGRAATIQCITPCEFLVIHKQDFADVLKADVLAADMEKLKFIEEHLPCLSEQELVPKPSIHPSYFWLKETFKQGHMFLKEGKLESKHIWMIRRGTVKLVRDAWCSETGVDLLKVYKHDGRPLAAKVFCPPKEPDVEYLGEGCVFSSARAARVERTEPVSVVVHSSHCDVFTLSGDAFKSIPDKNFEKLLQHVRRDMTKRLKTLCVRTQARRDPMQSPRASAFQDFRDAPSVADSHHWRQQILNPWQ